MLFSARSMNFYEELGVARSASIAEIQQAYKALVRILHPDQQQDEHDRKRDHQRLASSRPAGSGGCVANFRCGMVNH